MLLIVLGNINLALWIFAKQSGCHVFISTCVKLSYRQYGANLSENQFPCYFGAV